MPRIRGFRVTADYADFKDGEGTFFVPDFNEDLDCGAGFVLASPMGFAVFAHWFNKAVREEVTRFIQTMMCSGKKPPSLPLPSAASAQSAVKKFPSADSKGENTFQPRITRMTRILFLLLISIQVWIAAQAWFGPLPQ